MKINRNLNKKVFVENKIYNRKVFQNLGKYENLLLLEYNWVKTFVSIHLVSYVFKLFKKYFQHMILFWSINVLNKIFFHMIS